MTKTKEVQDGGEITVAHIWQFQPSHTNALQPDFIKVQQALNGVRAIARPPATKAGVNVMLILAPGDWLIGLSNGLYTKINEHAAYTLFGIKQGETEFTAPIMSTAQPPRMQ
jgi:hypothetical protein